ncbi:hypothetical protein C8N26_0905 [Tenacibaculum lutimaris]|uniref:Uncharacterized protein n=1 Tax=Tenacibaculum lutimaris TaxID=285258 RepID=A0A420E2C0_9FLAO|nr:MULTISPECIES: hypothetical protein [Tenacibaculum]RKF04242.1 hypothetical protein C8N26_0905 [Tenacibaculum lutimaris]
MGFGGSVSAMITSLKNNKRKRVSAFEKLERFQKENDDKLYFKKSASKKELVQLKKQVLKENKNQLIKNSILFFLIFVILVYSVFVFMNS